MLVRQPKGPGRVAFVPVVVSVLFSLSWAWSSNSHQFQAERWTICILHSVTTTSEARKKADAHMTNTQNEGRQQRLATETYDLQSLWEKYEDITMHFNDLLMRLRTQALAGIAAISTVIGLFTKADAGSIQSDWLVAAWAFAGLAVLWVAIACLDLLYYNRLLAGAVRALEDIEKQTKNAPFGGITLSTQIVEEFNHPWRIYEPSYKGVVAFYLLVLAVIIAGVCLSLHMHGLIAGKI